MAKEKQIYVQNTGDHGIKVHSADQKLIKRFDIEKFDALTGRLTHTGFTPLSKAEYDTLFKESKVFSHFLERGVLVRHEDLPEEAMTPRDALVSAKREVAEYAERIAELEAENKALAGKVAGLEAENKELSAKIAKDAKPNAGGVNF